jgi:hypothetical protein
MNMGQQAASGLIFTCNGVTRSGTAHRIILGDIAALSILHNNDQIAEQVIMFPQDETDGHHMFHRSVCILFVFEDGMYTTTILRRKVHTKVDVVVGGDVFMHGLSKPENFTLLINDTLTTNFAVTMVSPPCTKRCVAV